MKLLMHMCCAPCSTYPLKLFKEKGIEVEGLFYNPNIHPLEEYNHRRETVVLFAKLSDLKVTFIDSFMEEIWKDYNNQSTTRCSMCYSIRLNQVAKYAKEKGFAAFTTSLLVSPYQNHDLIKELGEKYSKIYNIPFYYEDFRKGYREGQNIARDLELYRQKYCGCIISYNERKSSI